MFNTSNYHQILKELAPQQAALVAVSKLKSVEDILSAYQEGLRDFGENYVQELCSKQPELPHDIRWHFIGHLQSNKVKYIAPFVHLIQGVDSIKLLKEINKQAARNHRIIKCLLQVHIATEETKFGFNEEEILQINPSLYPHLDICGVMGMASFSNDTTLVKNEFINLKSIYDRLKITHQGISILSMGMSGDYKIALSVGSNMLRIGSLIFGTR